MIQQPLPCRRRALNLLRAMQPEIIAPAHEMITLSPELSKTIQQNSASDDMVARILAKQSANETSFAPRCASAQRIPDSANKRYCKTCDTWVSKKGFARHTRACK